MADTWSTLRDPVVIAAFEGWNDAADAASEVVNHLTDTYPTDLIWELDSEDYYDFQTTRPKVEMVNGRSTLRWPTIRMSVVHMPHRDLVAISGPEPNLRWRSFCRILVSTFRACNPTMVIILGAMLTDSPHSRPLPVNASSADNRIIAGLGIEPSQYEGPTGIVSALADECRKQRLECVSLWASVPHYVSGSPNPKATLALLGRVEDLLDEAIDLGDLPELTRAWQRGVDELADEDPDVAEYIQGLEEQQDAEQLPGSTGDALAADFQRYLRHRRTR
ncbi:PAC2 family protein [Propionibacterium freudenreichii]|uniref:PAC2 family protein n=1 Tax=Propionibacterium freudenreichii TaxID=1744 RepID=UPI000543119F|nr:PAC2 family protein [Propionibacterium freudenreichii]CEG86931.1 Hypothetical protein PFCIRM118_09110 [Propionibacterium freudenreichii]